MPATARTRREMQRGEDLRRSREVEAMERRRDRETWRAYFFFELEDSRRALLSFDSIRDSIGKEWWNDVELLPLVLVFLGNQDQVKIVSGYVIRFLNQRQLDNNFPLARNAKMGM